MRGDIPYGFCHCGCGEKAPVSKQNVGYFEKGMPYRFIAGHQRRKSPVEYIVDEETGCWIWQRSIIGTGYGYASVGNKRSSLAHRVIYERLRGPIPTGKVLHHRCENPPCVNPDHMEVVSQAENIQRGKHVKVTPAIVLEIRALAGSVPQREIAKRFGIGRSTVSQIVRGYSWKDVSH